jgi:hypothetical protein
MSAPLASGELPPPAPIVDLTGNATKPHPERIARKYTIAFLNMLSPIKVLLHVSEIKMICFHESLVWHDYDSKR